MDANAARIETAPPAPQSSRNQSLDGLRGLSALIVVVFHYLCALHPRWVPGYSDDPLPIADTPLAFLWNGRFSVTVFFVVSGFVLAGAAERRRAQLGRNLVVRYLRLHIPVVASALLAWVWLTLAPTASRDLAASLAQPSAWLDLTYQDRMPSALSALYQGAVGVLVDGNTAFNNVLWTIRLEFIGSVALFVIYWAARGRVMFKVALACAFSMLAVVTQQDELLAFLTGCGLHEARRHGWLDRMPAWSGELALVTGVVVGAAMPGTWARLGVDVLPPRLTPGPGGLAAVAASTMIVFGTLRLRSFAAWLSTPVPRWLGRVSFALYLVHAPLVYTLVARLTLDGTLPEPVIATIFLAASLGLAEAFTRAVDAPTLRALRRVRSWGVVGAAKQAA